MTRLQRNRDRSTRVIPVGTSQPCLRIPTFVVEDALHFHATSRVGDAQRAAGNQAFCSGGPVGGPHQTPVRLVVGPLQNLHSLATADGQLRAVAGSEVVDHHCQLAAAGELGRERDTSASPSHCTYAGGGAVAALSRASNILASGQ